MVATALAPLDVGQLVWKCKTHAGILAKARVHTENVSFRGFTGAGPHIQASAGEIGATNANWCSIEHSRITYCGTGVAIVGSDAQGGLVRGIKAQGLGQYRLASGVPDALNGEGGSCVWDHSQGGNLIMDCYTEINTGPSYRNDAGTLNPATGCASLFFNCADEASVDSNVIAPGMMIGGVHGATNVGGSGMQIGGDGVKNFVGKDDTTTPILYTFMGLQDGKSFFAQRASVEAAPSGFVFSNNIPQLPDGWHAWLYNKNYVQGAFAVAGPGAKMPGGSLMSAAGESGLNGAGGYCMAVVGTLYFADLTWANDMPSIDFGAAAPVLGYWVRGSIRWNSTGGVGAPIGWKCTTTGTYPAAGAWTAMANL